MLKRVGECRHVWRTYRLLQTHILGTALHKSIIRNNNNNNNVVRHSIKIFQRLKGIKMQLRIWKEETADILHVIKVKIREQREIGLFLTHRSRRLTR